MKIIPAKWMKVWFFLCALTAMLAAYDSAPKQNKESFKEIESNLKNS